MTTDDRPDDVPARLWAAVTDLYDQIERIDGEAMSAGQIDQDPESERWTWRREVARVLLAHRLPEADRIRAALGELFRPDAVEAWLAAPCPGLDGRVPAALIRAGDTGPIWRMIEEVRRGTAV